MYPRDILYPILLLESGPDLVRQLPGHLDGVHAGRIPVQALPLCDPRLVGVGERDDALEDLRRAALDLVLRAGEPKELFAVGAALVAEALLPTHVSYGWGSGRIDGGCDVRRRS